jgi:hypothetical protein
MEKKNDRNNLLSYTSSIFGVAMRDIARGRRDAALGSIHELWAIVGALIACNYSDSQTIIKLNDATGELVNIWHAHFSL